MALVQALNNGGDGDDGSGDSSSSVLVLFCGPDALHTLSLIVTRTLVFEYDCLHFRGEKIEAQRD